MAAKFTIRGNPNLLGRGFSAFEEACASWYRDGRFGEVLRLDAQGRVVERFLREECDGAAKRFLSPEIAKHFDPDW